MCARHIKRAIEEFNIKLPKRLEEKEEKKPVLQYNCQVHVYVIYLSITRHELCTSQIKGLTSLLGNPQVFEYLENFCSDTPFPAKKLFKCTIIGPFQVIKCPHLWENDQITFLTFQ